jgi:hypothetical protein
VSPLTADNPDALRLALEELTTTSATKLNGRVNPAAASPVVLEAIGFTAEEARRAVEVRTGLKPADMVTFAWLASNHVLTAERFRALAAKMCGQGRQFHVQSVGYSRQLGLFHRLEAVVDISSGQPVMILCRDLTGLGPPCALTDDAGKGPVSSGR